MEQRDGEGLRLYVGTYTRGRSEGIYLLHVDPATGAMGDARLAAATENPSFLALDAAARHLYAVGEAGEGTVSAFAVDAESGELALLNTQPSLGSAPCHVSVHPSGRLAFVANYGSGSVCVLPVGEDGRLGEATHFVQHEGSSVDPKRQAGPHAHSMTPDESGRFVYAADLGLDRVMIYRVDAAAGTLEPGDPPHVDVAPGSGPRHLAFHPAGRWAVLIHEMGNTLTVFERDPAAGALREIQTVGTLPEGFEGASTTADVHVAPSGRFVYGSNRGHDSIAVYAVDPDTGRLACVGHEPTGGRTPRSFAIDPTGTFLLAANQDSDNIVAFRIDGDTGRLTNTGNVADVPAPVCLTFVRA